MGEQLYSGCIAAEPLVTGRSPCRWCDYGFHPAAMRTASESGRWTPLQSLLNRKRKREEDQ